MTAKNFQEAWEAAAAIMPTDFEHDSARSAAAGYPVYYSTAFAVEAWISDLGDRLEVNLPNGKSINIWIEEEKKEEEKTEAELDREAEETAENMEVSALYTPEVSIEITVAIDGEYGGRNQAIIYNGIQRGNKTIIFDVIKRYCALNDIKWGRMHGAKADFHEHGKDSGRGHYIISAVVNPSIGFELDFLTKCAALLLEHAEEHDSNRREREE